MVFLKHSIFFILLLALMSCGKNRFILDFDLNTNITENYNATYYATDREGGITVQAVASVRDGKCILNGITRKPTLVYVSMRNEIIPLVIYARKGDKIKISGDEKDPLSWNIEGNEINRELTYWRQENYDILKRNFPDSVNDAVKKFIGKNSDNPASTLLLLCYYDRKVNERGFTDLLGSLSGKALEPAWLRLVARTDQTSLYNHYPARLESLVMRSNKNGTDTLILDGKNPVVIFFWTTGYDKRKNMIDSLRLLTKDIPDSLKIIGDICVDIDSIAWKNSIRKDSLNGVKRFWAPMALNDTAVLKLKVKTLPCFIVFNKDGVQEYNGSDISVAMKTYRNLLKDKQDAH